VFRIRLVAIGGLAAVLLLSACGRESPQVSARSERAAPPSQPVTSTESSTPPGQPSTPPSTLPGFKLVGTGGLRFQVPDAWPVYDLASDPTRCVRFDEHAVYLGHAGADQNCPAQLVGRTDAVQVEPMDAVSQTTMARARQQAVINGLSVREDASSAITRSLVAAFDGVGQVATVTFADDDALAQKILGTFERDG
jgi:hypothetical protein